MKKLGAKKIDFKNVTAVFSTNDEKEYLRDIKPFAFYVQYQRENNKRKPDYWDFSLMERLKAFKLYKEFNSIIYRESYRGQSRFYSITIRHTGNISIKMPLV